MTAPVSSELVVRRPRRRLGATAVLLAIVAGALLGIFACASETAHATDSEHTSIGRHGGEHADQAPQPDATSSDSNHSSHSDHSNQDGPSRHTDDAVALHDGHANLSCAALINLGIDDAPLLSATNRVGEGLAPGAAQTPVPPDPPVPRRSMSL